MKQSNAATAERPTESLLADLPDSPATTALVGQVEDTVTPMFERLARDPNVDVDKLERILAMHERVLKQQAEAAFNVDFAAMLPEIPTIIEHSRTDKTSYAPLEDIIEPIRPVLSRFGFSLSFKTEWPNEKTVKVIGILTHRNGHARLSEFLSAADKTGSKNEIQALGSAVSYGKRYTAKDLLCIVTRGEDDDAKRAGRTEKVVDAPKGFDDWWTEFQCVADSGQVALERAWEAANKNPKTKGYLAYAVKERGPALNALKTKAARVAAQ